MIAALLLGSCDNVASFDRIGVSLAPDGTTIEIHYVACGFERVVGVRLEEVSESYPAETRTLWSVTSDSDSDQTSYAVGETPEGFEELVSFADEAAAGNTLMAAIDTEPGIGASIVFAVEDLRTGAVYVQDPDTFLDPSDFQEQAVGTCREQ